MEKQWLDQLLAAGPEPDPTKKSANPFATLAGTGSSTATKAACSALKNDETNPSPARAPGTVTTSRRNPLHPTPANRPRPTARVVYHGINPLQWNRTL